MNLDPNIIDWSLQFDYIIMHIKAEQFCFHPIMLQMTQQSSAGEGSSIDLDLGPAVDPNSAKNYKTIQQVSLYTQEVYSLHSLLLETEMLRHHE